MTTQERQAALMAGECPDHGCPLEEVVDVDEHGPWVTFACPVGCTFGSVHNPEMGYVPTEEETR